MKLSMLMVISFLPFIIVAQNSFSKTITSSDNTNAPNAEINQVAWISGHWEGEAFGGNVEEIWTPPLGNSMMCVFKLVDKGAIVFYEICTISEKDGSLILRLKHFNEDLKGWEEKDEVQEFPLVKIEKNLAYFDGFTFEKIDEENMNIYVRISNGDSVEEVPFYYSRKKS